MHGITHRPTETRKPNRQPRLRRHHPARPALTDHNTRIAYFNATAGVTITFNLSSWTSTSSGASGTVTGDASVGTDTFSGVNSASGSSFADTITGSDNPNGTAEEFSGRAGNDTIDGKGGFDRAFYNNDPTATGIQIDMASGVVTGDTAIETDTL